MWWLILLGAGYAVKKQADKKKAEQAAAQLDTMPEQATATGLRRKAEMVAAQGFELEAAGRKDEALFAFQQADSLWNEAAGIEHLYHGNGY